jgi:hypothetical protein
MQLLYTTHTLSHTHARSDARTPVYINLIHQNYKRSLKIEIIRLFNKQYEKRVRYLIYKYNVQTINLVLSVNVYVHAIEVANKSIIKIVTNAL